MFDKLYEATSKVKNFQSALKMSNTENIQARLLSYIRGLRTKKISVDDICDSDMEIISHPSMDLENIIETMQSISDTLTKAGITETHPIRQHLDHHMGTPASFDHPKYDHVFADKAQVPTYSTSNNSQKKNHDKMLDFSFKDGLSGFTSKENRLSWPEDKINEFFESMAVNYNKDQ